MRSGPWRARVCAISHSASSCWPSQARAPRPSAARHSGAAESGQRADVVTCQQPGKIETVDPGRPIAAVRRRPGAGARATCNAGMSRARLLAVRRPAPIRYYIAARGYMSALSTRLSLAFSSLGHTYAHLVMMLWPTVVLVLEKQWGMGYAELLPLAVAGQVLFGAGA